MRNNKSKKLFGALKLSATLATLAVGLGAGGIRARAAFDAPYYNININGGTFDGNQYVLDDGSVVTDSFFCDGTYTYFLQTDGTPMKDRLTYHPDGVKIIYFDSQGHECFDTFANVKKSIAGAEVDDLCYFGTYGDLYVNVITYNVEGTKLYYANPYGVMERNGLFELDTNAANYELLAPGCHYGYANSDGSVTGFYATKEEAFGLEFREYRTALDVHVNNVGLNPNREYITNVSQFCDAGGNICFAYNAGADVVVVKTKNGIPSGEQIRLPKETDVFGAVTCDSEGWYYVVTGEENTGDDTAKNTVFITKYDSRGNRIASTGNNGNSSLAWYYSDSYYTQKPFQSGTCDIAVNGDYVAVNYARRMYNGHQSNSLFVINRKTMETVNVKGYYNSHSFAQRVVPYGEKFLLASEGDCYDRAFTVSLADVKTGDCCDWNVFHFWVEEGALDRYDMYAINNNFAYMGGLAVGTEGRAAFVSASVKSMNSNAKNEQEQLFVQVMVPQGEDLIYLTQGTREGYSGGNGDVYEVDEGVRWLTDYSDEYRISNPQIVADSNGNYIILFERYEKYDYQGEYDYQGVYYTVLDGNGVTISDIKLLSADAYLNPTEMPVYCNGNIYWVGNNKSDGTSLYLYSISGRL